MKGELIIFILDKHLNRDNMSFNDDLAYISNPASWGIDLPSLYLDIVFKREDLIRSKTYRPKHLVFLRDDVMNAGLVVMAGIIQKFVALKAMRDCILVPVISIKKNDDGSIVVDIVY